MARERERAVYLSVGILSISGGSLLLLINNYASNSDYSFVSHSALGIVLLVTAGLLAYAAVSHCLSHAHLFSALCLTISALWCGVGLVNILLGQGVLSSAELSSSLMPGLVAFCIALILIGFVAIKDKKAVLFLISVGITLACAHQIADLSFTGFGHSATAACYLLVFLVGVYFGIGRLLFVITHGKEKLPGTSLKDKVVLKPEQDHSCSDMISAGLVMNLLSAAVIACPLFGVVTNAGHVCWLWTAAVYQFGICILLYRAMDTLAATFYAFMALLKFAEGYSILLNEHPPLSPVPFPVVFSVLFAILALFSCLKSPLDGLYQLFFTAYCIAFAAQPYGVFEKGVQGIQAAIFIVTAAMLFINSFSIVAPTKVLTRQGFFKGAVNKIKGVVLRADKDQHAPHLGFSKYADAEVLGHACNVLAAFAITGADGVSDSRYILVLPWVVFGGGVLQLLSGSVAFSRGKTFESTVFVLYGVLWTFWGFVRYGGYYGEMRGFNVSVGIISFLLFNFLVTVAALFLSVAWFVYALTFQLILLSFLLDAAGGLPYGYDIGASIIFGLVSFYCFMSKMFSSTFQSPQIPLGRPFIVLSDVVGEGSNTCPHVPARRATSVQQIAEIMKNGGICGMPTDTVYTLVAACNRPDAVVKAYRVKQQAEDRPMSMWISSIKQLEPVRHLLSPLLLDFMEAAWPSSISMVIPRGPWMDAFGLGDAAIHIGTPQSIAIRNPDCSVATHLINLVGPIAVTSANPSGEADTTHHNQVFAKLGNKVDGVLCDGPSPENIASTVVDCTKIESGHIGFFRVGLIPKSKVLQIFEEVQKRHKQGQTNAAFENDEHLGDTHEDSSINTDN